MKAKKCKNCKKPFKSFSSSGVACSINCAIELARKDFLKEEARIKREKKRLLILPKLAQKAFNDYIRERDKNKGCISCDRELNGKYDAGHYFTFKEYPGLRMDEFNAHGQCVYCNKHRKGNSPEYVIRLMKRIGEAEFEALTTRRNTKIEYSISDLNELIKTFKQKTKELRNAIIEYSKTE